MQDHYAEHIQELQNFKNQKDEITQIQKDIRQNNFYYEDIISKIQNKIQDLFDKNLAADNRFDDVESTLRFESQKVTKTD